MEIDAIVFIGAVIAGATQVIKLALPSRVTGLVTPLVAVALGALVAVFDTSLGVTEITLAQGLMASFGTVGVVSVIDRV